MQGLLFLIVAAEGARRTAASHRIEFIDEDDARCCLTGLLKQITDARRRPPRTFPRTPNRRSRKTRPGLPVTLGILEKGHHLLEFEFRFLNAGYVGTGYLDILLDIDLGPRLGDRVP